MAEQNRVILVTGGGTGIGRAAALRLAQDGLSVYVADADLAAAQETAGLITASGGDAAAFAVDVGQAASVDRLFAAMIKHFGRIDGFFSAVTVRNSGDFLHYSLEQWRETLGINLDGAILCCQHAVREMLRQGQGAYSILLSTPDGACLQRGDEAACCASGWALRGFMRHLARNLGKHDILVNTLAYDDSQAPAYAGPAAVVSFLLSQEARSITGMTLLDNGGAIMT